jgi:hypothetical protein
LIGASKEDTAPEDIAAISPLDIAYAMAPQPHTWRWPRPSCPCCVSRRPTGEANPTPAAIPDAGTAAHAPTQAPTQTATSPAPVVHPTPTAAREVTRSMPPLPCTSRAPASPQGRAGGPLTSRCRAVARTSAPSRGEGPDTCGEGARAKSRQPLA